MSDDTRKIADLTVDEFMEVLISKDEREILKDKIMQYNEKLAEIHAAMAHHKTAIAAMDSKTLSTPFELNTVEAFDTWAKGVRTSLSEGYVKGVVLMLGQK